MTVQIAFPALKITDADLDSARELVWSASGLTVQQSTERRERLRNAVSGSIDGTPKRGAYTARAR